MTAPDWLLPVATLAAFGGAAFYGWRGARGWVALALGVLIALLLAAQSRVLGGEGAWQVSLRESLLLSLMLAEACYLLVAVTARTMWRLALLVQPTLGAVYLLALLSPVTPEGMLTLTPLLAAHIGGALVAYGLLTMAAFAAFAVYTREAYLKAHSASGFSTRLPALDAADRGQFAALWMGAAVLAVALLAGAAYQHQQTGDWLVLTVKTVFTLATFAAMLALLVARKCWGTRGARAAKRIMLTYALLVVAFMSGKIALLLPQ
jgi:ABC-type uncharacterized transport system permease subunit